MFQLQLSTTKKDIYLECSSFELFYFIKGSISYLFSLNKSNINNNTEYKDENIQLIKLLETYCILYETNNISITQSQNQLLLTDLNSTKVTTEITLKTDISNLEDTNIILSNISDNSLFEFWATFTSCWHIFVKYKLEGLYLLLITFRTFDSEKITISKEIVSTVYNSLLVVYPYNKDELNKLILFFDCAVKNKCGIESKKLITISNINL